MANTSGDLALEKIAGTDKAKLFPTPFNQDMEDIDEAITDLTDEKAGSSEIGIVVNGNKTAFPTGAANGQFVILRNSTITGCDDGLYKAAKVIPYDTVIDSTYLTPCPEGAANALNASLTPGAVNNITPNTGSILEQAWYRKTGNFVELALSFNGLPGSNTVITTLPIGYRPSHSVYFKGYGDGLGNTVTGIIKSSGDVTVNSVGGFHNSYCLFMVD